MADGRADRRHSFFRHYYLLRRSTDGQDFADVSASFTGGGTNTFSDPAPPTQAATVLYQIWEAAPG